MEKEKNKKKIDKNFKQFDKYFKTEKTIFEEKNKSEVEEKIKPGINIIGKCLNKECKSFEKTIILKNEKEKISICSELIKYSKIKCQFCKNILNLECVSLFQCNFHIVIYALNGNKLSVIDKVNKNNVFSIIFIIKDFYNFFKDFYITTNENIYLSEIEEIEQNLKNLEIKNEDDKNFYNWLIKEKENKKFLYNNNINYIVDQINNYAGSFLNPSDIENVYLNDSEKQKERIKKIEEICDIILEKKMTFSNYCKKIIELGNEIKNDIIYRIYHSPEQFYSKFELNQIKENSPLFIQAVLKEYLNSLGILTVIEKNSSKKFKFYKVMNHLINSGDIYDNILTIKYFDLKNENLIIFNQIEQKKFIQEKQKLFSKILKIEENKISISNLRKGCLQIDVRIKDDLNEVRIGQLRNGDSDISECLTKRLLDSCQISRENFDKRGNRKRGWGEGEKRGPPNHLIDYDPPKGFEGYGLNVWGKYDNANNDWLNYKNVEGEWYIAYHGTKRTQAQENGGIINNIINNGFRHGGRNNGRQMCQNYDNFNPLNRDQIPQCGNGVYLSPLINTAEFFSGRGVRFNGHDYKVVFMCRINPKKVRIAHNVQTSRGFEDYWIVSGELFGSNTENRHDDEIRPYRILLKKIDDR